MNLHQFRFVREAIRRNFSLTDAAKALHTSQPGVSKAIIELEDELGVQIFDRHGKRVRGLTEPGKEVAASVERIMQEIDNLKRVAGEFAARDSGELRVAATHTQARYAMPRVVQAFKARYPEVRLQLHQGSPTQIADLVLKDQADFAIATEAVAAIDGLVSLPCYQWQHCVVVQPDHPLTRAPLTLEALVRYPLITYVPEFTGRNRINRAFEARQLSPDIILEAIDADVIKTYVELGLGVGIIAAVAFDRQRDANLVALPAGHLFGTNVTRLAFKKGVYLRGFAYDFISLFAPEIDRRLVDRLLGGESESYEL